MIDEDIIECPTCLTKLKKADMIKRFEEAGRRLGMILGDNKK